MSRRSQAGCQAAASAVTSVQEIRHPPAHEAVEPSSKWSVYRQAIEGGWGSTARLCLILFIRCGVPATLVTGGVKLASILCGHAH